jgi:hypothetical protein
MHVYLQWPGGQPPVQKANQWDAEAEIRVKYPSAHFTQRRRIQGGMVPGFGGTSLEEGIIVFPDTTSKDSIAVIWFPVP